MKYHFRVVSPHELEEIAPQAGRVLPLASGPVGVRVKTAQNLGMVAPPVMRGTCRDPTSLALRRVFLVPSVQ